MNRQNFFVHLALAVAVIILAAFVGQLQRMSVRTHDEDAAAERVEAVEDQTVAQDVDDDAVAGYEDAQVMVRFRPGTDAEEIEAIAARLNDRLEDRYEFVDGWAAIADEDGLDAEAVAREYRALPGVLDAEPVVEISLDPLENLREARERAAGPAALGAPNDPLFNEQWALANTGQRDGKAGADISALRAWAKTQGSGRVVVAVIDTGVDYNHLDLSANVWTRPAGLAPYSDPELGTVDDVHGFDAADLDGDPMDDNGHGTHVAGIIGAVGDNNEGMSGVNWKVEIMPLKFLGRNGSGTTRDAIECINYAIARKRDGVNVRVISASWGSTMYSRALEDAIRAAGREGILFVAAAGNSSTSNDRRPHYPSNYNLPNVLSVAALNRHDALAHFSNYGAKTVHLAAPGAEILSTWLNNEYEEHSGTSMATPVVSGVAALVLALNPDLTAEQLRARLLDSVDKLPALEGKVASGGRVNAARAVRAD